MTRAFWTEVGRWLIAIVAAGVVFYGSVHLAAYILLFGPLPEDLAAPTAGFLMVSLVVLAGSLLAPRQRPVVAMVLCVVGTVLGRVLLSLPVPGALAGGLVSVAFVAWWSHPRRTARSTRWVGGAVGVALVAYVGLVYARRIDRPAYPDPLPDALTRALGTNASRVTLYRYDLGGFLDHEWLWRVDATPDVVARVVSGLGLQSTEEVPSPFWRMPPHYWPRSMPAGGEAFRSPMFSGDSRGSDGEHYFLVHDRNQGRAFVWLKSNF